MNDRLSSPFVTGFYDERTFSVQYVVACPQTRRCAIIDPVLDFDEKSGAVATISADAVLAFVADRGLTVDWVLDTHPHADHLSAAHHLRGRTGAQTAIGARVVAMQALWAEIYGWTNFPCDGSQWDRLFDDGERFQIGEIDAEVVWSPGHTPASISYLVGDAAFVHDTLFMPDSGTARADFPGGSANQLYQSIQQILAMPDATRLFTGHDYRKGGREVLWESTVVDQRTRNIHLGSRPTVDEFVAIRETRDRGLPMPRLILHALQVNLHAGRLPEPEANGRRYFKFPLDALPGACWS